MLILNIISRFGKFCRNSFTALIARLQARARLIAFWGWLISPYNILLAWRVKRRELVKKQELQGLLMTSRKPSAGRYPEKTFHGRKRVSLWPRWVSNWIITGAIIYFMGSYALRFAGVDTAGWDPFARDVLAAVPTVTALPDYPLNDQESFHASSNLNDNLFANTPTPVSMAVQAQPTYTPMPTYTPYPTQAPYFGKLIAVGYSYYWPPFGPPNCGPDNWHADINFCDDMTASGLQWSLYVSHGVAVPVQWRDDIPLGSTIRVHSPASMVGDYLVLDYCGACIKPEGHIYFDFLDNRARLNWTVPMLVEVIKP